MRSRVGVTVAIAVVATFVFAQAALAVGPTVGTPTVESSSYNTAILKADFDPGDEANQYLTFQYAELPAESWSGCFGESFFEKGSGNHVGLEKELAGLKPGHEYAVRLCALNAEDFFTEVHSPEPNPTFTTTAVPNDPVPALEPATPAFTSAHLEGTIDPEESPVPLTYRFEYSTDPGAEFWTWAGSGEIPLPEAETTDPIAVETDLSAATFTELTPATTYYYRLVASNGNEFRSPEPFPSFETGDVPPPAVAIDPVTTFDGTTAEFTGTIDPEATASDPAFEVDWHFECTPECSGDLEGHLGADSDPHLVEGEVTGLDPNTSYEVTLVGENAGGEASDGPESFMTDEVAPVVQTLYAGPVGEETATLAARINPRNSAGVSYQFEWGEDDSYGNLTAAEALGASNDQFHVVTADLTGLDPESEYHFRLVADNGTDTSEGVDHRFDTLSTTPAAVPDRGYEKVSPSAKNGYDVTGRFRHAASLDGERVTFSLRGVGPNAKNGGPLSTYFARRTGQGWDAGTPVDPLVIPKFGNATFFTNISPDLTKVVLTSPAKLTPDGSEDAGQVYVQDLAAGTTQLASPVALPPLESTVTTPDFSRVLFEAGVAQTSDSVSGWNTYEWIEGQGTRLVDFVPSSGTVCGGTDLPCVTPPNGGLPGSGHNGRSINSLSEDGRRVFFHEILPSVIDGASSNAGALFVRDDQGTPGVDDDTTTQVNASQRSTPDPVGPLPAFFWDAESAHGSKVLFTSCEKLTDDSTASTLRGTGTFNNPVNQCDGSTWFQNFDSPGRDLYLYDVDTGHLSDLTTSDPRGGEVYGVVGASDSLDRIYFVAGGVLALGAVAQHPNLYVWEEGETHLIATLERRSCGSLDLDISDCQLWQGAYAGVTNRSLRVGKDGRYVLFASRTRLTGSDNASAQCIAGACSQIFLYDAESRSVRCVSCSPGIPVKADAALNRGSKMLLSNYDEAARNLAEDGSYAFFETPEALLPDDSNGAADTYYWAQGRLSLVSTGRGAEGAQFLDASANGRDVFLLTRERLVDSDVDGATDLYDARVGGGFPSSTPVPLCEGDACLTPPVAPNDPTPASAGLLGTGNASESRPACRKGKVRRHGRCVKKRKSKKHRTNHDRRKSR